VTVTPRAAAFDPGRSFAEVDQSECLAEVLYYEARGEGTEGEKAVAEVVLQRTHDAYYPHTICGVVYEGVQPDRKDCQFSFACDGALHKPKERGAWRNVRILADKILSGAVKLAGETGHAIAYHSVDVDPAWAQDMVETAQIGNHIFYRRDPSRMTASTAESDSGRQADNAPQKIDGVTDGSTEVHSEVQTADAVGQGA
jgi:spore germination cell wall hydrolase CwlJ-like protein